MWEWLLNLLRDSVWQGVGALIALMALIYTVCREVKSRKRDKASWLGRIWTTLLNRAKEKVEALSSTIQSLLRSAWGRRILAFWLLLLILEYVRSQLPLWPVTLLTFSLQLLLLLGLVFQIFISVFERANRDTASRLQSFIVDAHLEDGIDTGLSLQPGQQVRIVATGEVSIDGGKTWMRPSGVTSQGPNTGKRHRGTGTHLDDQDGQGIIGTLIGWIGEDRDTSSFLIGDTCTRIIDRSGNLHLGINDTRGAYRDNIDEHGEPTFFVVHVRVLK